MNVLGLMTGAMLIAVLPVAGQAQQKVPQPLVSSIEQRKVVRAANGAETLVPADRVKPGDVIEYVATYRNTTRQPLSALVATLPIPLETEYLPGSARPANPLVSADGQRFGALPLKRTVKVNGVDTEEALPVRDVRYLRWTPGNLAGGQTVTYAARVRIVE